MTRGDLPNTFIIYFGFIFFFSCTAKSRSSSDPISDITYADWHFSWQIETAWRPQPRSKLSLGLLPGVHKTSPIEPQKIYNNHYNFFINLTMISMSRIHRLKMLLQIYMNILWSYHRIFLYGGLGTACYITVNRACPARCTQTRQWASGCDGWDGCRQFQIKVWRLPLIIIPRDTNWWLHCVTKHFRLESIT